MLPHRGFRLSRAYHNSLPASPPSIHPVDDIERVSGHQSGVSGELCLSIRGDGWSPGITGADWIEAEVDEWMRQRIVASRSNAG